jgi:hypothetical protein
VSTVSTSHRLVNSIDFASTQCVILPCSPDTFDSCAQPDRLSRMLDSYFSVAQRCAGGLVRIRWEAGRPRFVLAWPRLTLIAMGEPRCESSADRRAISLAVIGGWLVNPAPTARLAIALERRPESLRARVELIGYQPRGARNALVGWLYGHTQARVHALVGRRFLRQLAKSACPQGCQ